MEAKDLICFGSKLEHIQCLINNSITKNGPYNYVGSIQMAHYTIVYWGPARLKEVKE